MTLTCYTISSTFPTQEIKLSQTIRRWTSTIPATNVLSLVKTGKSSTVHRNITSFVRKVRHYIK